MLEVAIENHFFRSRRTIRMSFDLWRATKAFFNSPKTPNEMTAMTEKNFILFALLFSLCVDGDRELTKAGNVEKKSAKRLNKCSALYTKNWLWLRGERNYVIVDPKES